MAEKTNEVRLAFLAALEQISSVDELEKLRVEYTGKKGYVTELLKEMKSLSVEEKKTFGQAVNVLKDEVNEKITEKREELKQKEIELENSRMPEFDISLPVNLERGSYHPITLVQRQCEEIFKSMGFTVEDYSEIVTDYECFESLNIPKNHPA
ncbi:MAG: phenylalanine--tRNA ligase subunit alpha, partial [Clostridia bacterium]|nr:phenylalanine--tRNA ligase subunit alpha [Clostridia bacterium]